MLLLLPILLFVSLTWGKSKSNSERWGWKAVVFAMILCAAWPIEVREHRSAIDTMFVVYGLALQTMCAWSAAWAVSRFLPVNWLNWPRTVVSALMLSAGLITLNMGIR
jgi:hypothetical protein